MKEKEISQVTGIEEIHVSELLTWISEREIPEELPPGITLKPAAFPCGFECCGVMGFELIGPLGTYLVVQ